MGRGRRAKNSVAFVADSSDKIPESELDQALADYLSNVDAGSPPDRKSFLERYSPELRDQLSELLSIADLLDQVTQQSRANPPQPGFSHIFGPSIDAATSSPSPIRLMSADLSVDSSSGIDPHSDTQPFLLNKAASEPTAGEDSSQAKLPRLFGEYELIRVLGRGGMGVVYFARQIQLDRLVAVKMIRSGALASDEEVARFYTEARSAARLNHPRIVTVFQCGEHDGHHYFSMDYIEGTDLDKLMRQGRMDGKRAARYVRDAAEAIQFAHDRGILHRDLKPANLLVDPSDAIRITDFGLAKTVGKENGLTASGAALGTPSYMSPEQAAGNNDEQNYATDVYSLGAVLYTILAGSPPFKGDTVLQTLLHVIHRAPPKLRSTRPDLPEDLETIIGLCMQKSPEKRYQSAAALGADLDLFLKGLPISARPIPKWRRAWDWVLGIPVVGAMMDHRVIEPTDTHRWVQRGLITAGSLMLFAWLLVLLPLNFWFSHRMPRVVRLAAGVEGGHYETVANTLAGVLNSHTGSNVELFNTQGARDNIGYLSGGTAELAMIQADMAGELEVAVIAPLFYEVVHILCRTDLSFDSLDDLRGRRVYMGREKAGSRSTALRLLKDQGVPLEELAVVTEEQWKSAFKPQEEPSIDAAILVTGVGSEEVQKLLLSGTFQLMSLPDPWEFALKEPSFHTFYVQPSDYPKCSINPSGVSTIATAAFLVCREDATEVLVNETLRALYSPEVMALGKLWTAEEAAHWQGIAWHPTARAFFRAYRGSAEVR